MNVLEVNGVNKTFGRRQILKDFSFSCKTGEIIGLFGRNGSGKSTLLKAMMGTLKVNTINMSLNGRSLTPSEVIPQQKIGFLPQDTFLPKEMKVRDVIPLMFQKGEKQDKIFYAPGVSAFDNKRIGVLSVGQLKYFELLLLANLDHPFLLLDEPFSLVEPHNIERIKELLLSLRSSKGMVITDHYYEDVVEIATRSYVIKNGSAFNVMDEEDLRKHKYLKQRSV